MSRREAARVEARFSRGEVGIDGAAVEEVKDEAELEQGKARDQLLRGRTYLGREFLTWLLWQSEAGDPIATFRKESLVVLAMGRVVLRGIHGEVTELQAKGTVAPYSELVKGALDRGLLVHQARWRLTLGERTFEVTVDAEFLDVRSAKLPELLTEEEDDRAAERLDLMAQLSEMLELLVDRFLSVRHGKTWSKQIVPQLKAWMRGDGATGALKKAARA